MINSKPSVLNYNLRTDQGRIMYNNAIDEYYKKNKINVLLPISSDNIYNNKRYAHTAINFDKKLFINKFPENIKFK